MTPTPRILIQQVNPRQNGLVIAHVTPPNSSQTHRIGHLTSEDLWWCSCTKGTRCKWIDAVNNNPHFEVAT